MSARITSVMKKILLCIYQIKQFPIFLKRFWDRGNLQKEVYNFVAGLLGTCVKWRVLVKCYIHQTNSNISPQHRHCWVFQESIICMHRILHISIRNSWETTFQEEICIQSGAINPASQIAKSWIIWGLALLIWMTLSPFLSWNRFADYESKVLFCIHVIATEMKWRDSTNWNRFLHMLICIHSF